MSHWTHFVTEEDINATPKHEVFHFSFNNPEALRAEIIEMLAEEDPKDEWKAFLDSLPAWQRQWSEAPLRRLKERKDKAFECEAQSAEHKGLSKLVNLESLRKS